jgi:uncharacterized Zn-finger protein
MVRVPSISRSPFSKYVTAITAVPAHSPSQVVPSTPPRFDVFRFDVRCSSLVHVASSISRWTNIPFFPLPRVPTSVYADETTPKPPISPASSKSSSLLDTENNAVAAQLGFELEIFQNILGADRNPRIHNQENGQSPSRRHICPRCRKRFHRPSSLLAHQQTHTDFKRTFNLFRAHFPLMTDY